jgi:hypothetical protein
MNLRLWFIGLATLFIVYSAGVIASGSGVNLLGIKWHFENSGQFGDSFGPLASVMSAIAAIAALMAYRSQREELDRLKATAVEDKIRQNHRDFEDTFFKLLTLFRDTVNQIDVSDPYNGTKAVGPDAFQRLIWDYLVREDKTPPVELNEKIYKEFYIKYQNDLGHYFRLFYHIVRFIDSSEIEDRMSYIRYLRSLLSNSEMILIGMNCAFGAGSPKLKILVEKYALLHNISADSARRHSIVYAMDKSAFGDRRLGKDGLLSS